MNRRIKLFSHSGEFLDDSVVMISRVSAELALKYELRDKGYARILDIDVGWFTHYDSSIDKWEYTISMYAIYVGKKKARECEGWSQGKLIPLPTRQLISNQ